MAKAKTTKAVAENLPKTEDQLKELYYSDRAKNSEKIGKEVSELSNTLRSLSNSVFTDYAEECIRTPTKINNKNYLADVVLFEITRRNMKVFATRFMNFLQKQQWYTAPWLSFQ